MLVKLQVKFSDQDTMESVSVLFEDATRITQVFLDNPDVTAVNLVKVV